MVDRGATDEHRDPAGAPPDGAGPGSRLDRRSAVTALAVSLSLLFHSALLVTLALVLLEAPAGASREEGSGEIALAVISEAQLAELRRESLSVEFPTEETPLEPETFEFSDYASPVPDAVLESPSLEDIGGLSGAGAEDVGEGLESASDASGSAQFFGVEARGSRFAFVVDVSGSMAGPRIEALKRALLESIGELSDQSSFTIVLYNSGALSIPADRWFRATDGSKREVERRVGAIRATGGTNPLPAFDVVLSIRPRPDAIYFMTDGRFDDPEAVARTIAARNLRGRTVVPIHCITFVERDSEQIMRRIARRSGGTYTHVEGTDP